MDFESRFDQSTYIGRAKYYFATTNPLNCLASDAELDRAKSVIQNPSQYSREQIFAAKDLYDSAFHPDTGEKNFLLGRMAFQVPGNMLITGCMMSFYKTTPAVVFWQFANQSFNSIVNYTNRNASTAVSNNQLLGAYAAATTASVSTALALNKFVASRPTLASGGLIGRLVPLAAVAAANCVNIPLMRQRELLNGIDVFDERNDIVGKSQVAASDAVLQVIPSRILMATPAMFIPPVIMNVLEKKNIVRHKIASPLLTVALTGLCLAFSTPLCCALFPQKSEISVSRLEESLKSKSVGKSVLYYNKGL